MRMNRFVITLLSIPAIVGCLKTRAELRSENREPARVDQQEILIAQRQQQPRPTPPPPSPQYQEDAFEQLRNLSGRIDVVENQLNQMNAAQAGEKDSVAKAKKELDQKFVAYEEALKKLDAQVLALSDEITKMREEMAANAAAASAAPSKGKKSDKNKKNNNAAYEEGEKLVGQKKWREAIIAFEEYRKSNPKGKHYADATYKIGVCMQEVGMRAEAKLFYDEVISKFPGSKEAKKAAYRLKTIK